MSGHSKWSKVKHQKASSDVVKSQAFTKASRAIIVAVREGGGITDPERNFRLRLALDKARAVNMPKDTMERAVIRGAGETGRAIESVIYEGYGPGGAAILIEAATDNRQRTVSEIKHVLDRAGGALTSPGAVAYAFTRAGVLVVPQTSSFPFDRLLEIAIESGADDVVSRGKVFEIYTEGSSLPQVKEELVRRGVTIEKAELVMKPRSTVVLSQGDRARFASLTQELTSLEDVQGVYTNVTTPEGTV